MSNLRGFLNSFSVSVRISQKTATEITKTFSFISCSCFCVSAKVTSVTGTARFYNGFLQADQYTLDVFWHQQDKGKHFISENQTIAYFNAKVHVKNKF